MCVSLSAYNSHSVEILVCPNSNKTCTPLGLYVLKLESNIFFAGLNAVNVNIRVHSIKVQKREEEGECHVDFPSLDDFILSNWTELALKADSVCENKKHESWCVFRHVQCPEKSNCHIIIRWQTVKNSCQKVWITLKAWSGTPTSSFQASNFLLKTTSNTFCWVFEEVRDESWKLLPKVNIFVPSFQVMSR